MQITALAPQYIRETPKWRTQRSMELPRPTPDLTSSRIFLGSVSKATASVDCINEQASIQGRIYSDAVHLDRHFLSGACVRSGWASLQADQVQQLPQSANQFASVLLCGWARGRTRKRNQRPKTDGQHLRGLGSGIISLAVETKFQSCDS